MINFKKIKKVLGRKDVMIGILLGLIIYCAIRDCNLKEGYRRRGDRKKSSATKIYDKIPSVVDTMAALPIAYKKTKEKVNSA